MRELYGATEAVFRGGRGSDAAGGAPALSARTLAYDARVPRRLEADPAAEAWADAMEDAYFTAFDRPRSSWPTPALSARGGRAAAPPPRAGSAPTATPPRWPSPPRDRQRPVRRPGRGASSAPGANVVGARVFTSRTGQALDVFYVQDAAGQPFGADTPRSLERLTREPGGRRPRRAVAAGAAPAPATSAARRPSPSRRGDASTTTPRRRSTVVEASGRDRPGLLAALARTLADAGPVDPVGAHRQLRRAGGRRLLCAGPRAGSWRAARRRR